MEEQTDLQRFIALYKSIGIELEPVADHDDRFGKFSLVLEVRKHPKIGGYGGFSTDINFDADGKFVIQNIWE
jgi:hypothetical protein